MSPKKPSEEAAKSGEHSFVYRHPGPSFAIAMAILSGLWGVVQWYAQKSAAAAVSELTTEQYREATEGEIKGVKDDLNDFKTKTGTALEGLRNGIKEVGRLQLEQGEDQRRILTDLAAKRGVEVKDKTPELNAAEAAVEHREKAAATDFDAPAEE